MLSLHVALFARMSHKQPVIASYQAFRQWND
jgi:hypothetical protein